MLGSMALCLCGVITAASRQELGTFQHALEPRLPAPATDPTTAANATDRVVVFTHIPKSAGTAVNALLHVLLESEGCTNLHSATFPNLGNTCMDFEQTVRNEVNDSHCIGISDHAVVRCWARVFAESSDAATRQYATDRLRYVTGHITHSVCGANGTFSGRQCELVTIVRHPVDRLISAYTYVTSGNASAGEAGRAHAQQLRARYPTVESLLEAIAIGKDLNASVPGTGSFAFLTTVLGAPADAEALWPQEWPQPSNTNATRLADMLVHAKDVLESRYTMVGVTLHVRDVHGPRREFQDFASLLALRYGIAPAALPCGKVLPHGTANTGEVQSHTDLAHGLKSRLTAALRADLELFYYAENLMEKSIATAGKRFTEMRRALDAECEHSA
jgi:hypothetical protein